MVASVLHCWWVEDGENKWNEVLGANTGEDGRQLAEKEKVARRGAKLLG